jgi:hypothetical protein
MGAQIALPGTATQANVLSGQTFSSSAGFNVAGTMPAQGSPTFTPTTSAIAIPAGNYTGGTVAAATLGAVGGLTVVGSTAYTITLGFTPNRVTFNWGGGLEYWFDNGVSTTDVYDVTGSAAIAITFSISTGAFSINITGVPNTYSANLEWTAIS